MKVMDDLKDMLHEELKEVVKKGDISATELDNVCKAVKTLNYLETIKAMEEYGGQSRDYSGRSYDGSYGSYGSYNRGGSYDGSYDSYDRGGSYARRGRDGDGDGRYAEDYSGRRGRDAMGRYTSRDGGYSGHDKQQMVAELENMMQRVSPEEKKGFRQAIDALQNS